MPGTAAGRFVVYQRTRHGEALGRDEFLAPGLAGLAYGVSQPFPASGFMRRYGDRR